MQITRYLFTNEELISGEFVSGGIVWCDQVFRSTDAVISLGYPGYMTETHCPEVFEKDKMQEIFKIFDPLECRLLTSTLYFNVFPYELMMKDRKVERALFYGYENDFSFGSGETQLNRICTGKYYLNHNDDGLDYSAECPSFTSISKNMDSPYFYYGCNVANRAAYTAVSFLAISLYHGRKTFSFRNYPYTSFDQYSLDGTIDTRMSLKPIYLYDNVYLEFLNWQTYRTRGFTKYIQLSLLQLLALQWGRRYMINGSVVILDTINYDLPYTGTVEVSGFTA